MKPLFLCLFLASVSATFAADAPGSKDPAALKRIGNSEIIWAKEIAFDEMTLPLEKVQFDYDKQTFKPTKKVTIEGAHSILYYKVAADVSTLEAVRQYQADLREKGFEVLFDAANDNLDDGYNRFVTQTFPREAKTAQLEYLHEFNHEDQRYSALQGQAPGGDLYVSIYAFKLADVSTGFDQLVATHRLEKGQTVVRVDVLKIKGMDARMKVVKAEEINQTLDTAGRIAIYGVYFDTDKSLIKPESAESLAEMAKAIKGGGRFLIVGHTDNQGDFEHNQKLSLARAKAVTAALVKDHGIAAANIIPVGVGMAAPVGPNTDDQGRAKNRRVEIVRM